MWSSLLRSGRSAKGRHHPSPSESGSCRGVGEDQVSGNCPHLIVVKEGLYRGESLEKVKGSVKPFDWTFTTDYTGTLTGPMLVGGV